MIRICIIIKLPESLQSLHLKSIQQTMKHRNKKYLKAENVTQKFRMIVNMRSKSIRLNDNQRFFKLPLFDKNGRHNHLHKIYT